MDQKPRKLSGKRSNEGILKEYLIKKGGTIGYNCKRDNERRDL